MGNEAEAGNQPVMQYPAASVPQRPASFWLLASFLNVVSLSFCAPVVNAAPAPSGNATAEQASTVTLPSGLKLSPKLCLAAPGQEQDIAVAEDTIPVDLVDPLFHHTGYIGAVGGWVFDKGSWKHQFRVCYEGGGHPLARQVAELLARFYCYGKTRLRFGTDAGDTAFQDMPQELGEPVAPTNFYLDNGDTGGGKEQDGALYIFQAKELRHPVELAREVAHEFSHLTIPGIRGFGPPEDWTNGYLGEVLYLSWLSEDIDESVIPRDEVGTWSFGRTDALINAFLKVGPGPLIQVPAGHFWAFEGMLLYQKQTHGQPLLSRLLAHSKDLERQAADKWQMSLGYAMSGFSTAARGTDSALVAAKYAAEVDTSASAANGPDRNPKSADQWAFYRQGAELVLPPGGGARCWIYLRRGQFNLNVNADGPNWQLRGASLDPVSHYWIGGFSAGASTAPFRASSEAWYHLQWRNTGDTPLTIKAWSWIPAPGT